MVTIITTPTTDSTVSTMLNMQLIMGLILNLNMQHTGLIMLNLKKLNLKKLNLNTLNLNMLHTGPIMLHMPVQWPNMLNL